MTAEALMPPGTPIALAAFRLSASDPSLDDRLRLAAPEVVPERDPSEWGIRPIWLFREVRIDAAAGRYFYRFEPHIGSARVREWEVVPWNPTGAPDFGNTLGVTIHSLKVKAADAWEHIAARFQQLLVDGAIVVAGREDSPLAPVASVPSGAWMHFQMHDWEKGYAEGDHGERLYGLQVASPMPSANEDNDGLEPDRRGWKRRRTKEIIEELFPGDTHRALPDKELTMRVKERFAIDHPNERPPGVRTVRRASGRD